MALHALLVFLMLIQAPQEGARFEGNVTKLNGEPLRGVRVQLNGGPNPSTTTDERGLFSFESIAPGSYNVTVQLSGYGIPGAGPALGSIGTSIGRITLAAGERVRDFHVDMVGTGTISGRIVGADGKPLPNVGIQGLRRTYQDGQPRLSPFNLPSPARSDDRGEYRVISLPAGEYYLMANMQSVLSTYYPGTRDPDKAKPILVTDGGETPSIDFVMHAGSPSIDGTVRPAVPQATVAQMVIAPIPRDPAASMVTSYGFAFDPQATPPGQFSIRTFSLSPGLYDLHAVMTTLDMDYFGSTTITVGDQAIDNVAIQLHPGVELKGHVTLQGNSSDIKLNDAPIAIRSRLYNSANRTSQVRTLLTLQAMDTARRTGAQLSLPREIPPSSPVGNDGTFTIRSIPAGAFTIQPATPPGACLIDVVQEGKSVLATGFTVGATSPAPLEVTISSACPSIAGLLQSKQQPQRFTRVVLVPTGERQRSYGLYRTVMTDQNGRFSFENVTPGEYKLFSWRSIPDGAWTNAEYLARYMERGTSVTAREGPATATVEFITD